ncbi:hypothetical protein ACFSTH_11445 [Paenibacillus yanchengensis]
MKRILRVITLSLESFIKVFVFNKQTVIFIIMALVFSSISMYFEIFLTKTIVDSLFNGQLQLLYYSIIVLVFFQILNSYLNNLSFVKTTQLSIAFTNKLEEELIDNIKNIDLIHKENPKFGQVLFYV